MKAMHKQKTATQERRSMRLLATGEFEAAEQHKLAIIRRAEGEREAVIQVAQGKAEAIRLVNEAAERYFTEHGISPTLLLSSLPVSVSSEKDAR